MTPMTAAALEKSRELAAELGQLPEDGTSWFFVPVTDKSEAEHRVDLLAGQLFCTCQGFLRCRHCKHTDEVRRTMTNDMTQEVAIRESAPMPALARQNPAALAVRLQDMKENRRLVRQFFSEAMEEGVDYGVIPGTDKPTLFKPGAEGLCELYGYAPTIKHIQETKDMETGFLRCVVTIALIQRGTGEVVAEGIGECNTREARYFYRWMPEWEMKKFPELWNVRSTMKSEVRTWKANGKRQAGSATFYRVENDDLFTLWNTVTKMAKKRAHVDATLSATRSSGIFSQGQAALEDWIEAEYIDVTPEPGAPQPANPPPVAPAASPDPATAEQRKRINDLWKAHRDDRALLAEARRRWPDMDKLSSVDADAVIAFLEGEAQQASDSPATTTPASDSAAAPAASECEHEGVVDEQTTLLTCGKCGLVLEEPAPNSEQGALIDS